jgi:hypothetical protein
MALTNSKRLLYSANHVTTELTGEDQQRIASQPEGALRKLAFVGALGLGRQDIERLRPLVHEDRSLERVLEVAANSGEMSHLEAASIMSKLPADHLIKFGELVQQAKVGKSGGIANVLLQAFKQQQRVSPVGRLHLERMEMYQVGVEKGELIFTVPMAPGETVTVSHKEWATSSQEYEEIVQDAFESYSERGVAEKTDASMSAENESKHSDRLNFGSTLTGSYGPVTLTTTFGLDSANDERNSVKTSLHQNKEVTEKASARARQEHKVSIKLETKRGTEDSSFRTISNPSNTARRIDYYKMMRKWRSDLYRYGLRMTYDLAIPTPGVRFWARWQRIAALDDQIKVPFVFPLKPEDLTDTSWPGEAAKYGAVNVPSPPHYTLRFHIADVVGPIGEDDRHKIQYGKLEFDVPAGYKLSAGYITAYITKWSGEEYKFRFYCGSTTYKHPPASPGEEAHGNFDQFNDATGHVTAVYMYQTIQSAALNLDVVFERLPETTSDWQKRAWEAIRNVAFATYQDKMARLQAERDQLFRLLTDKDTLSLRRLEREEMIRLIMQWLLGPGSGFSNAPSTIQSTLDKLLSNEQEFLTNTLVAPAESPTFTNVTASQTSAALLFGELVKFAQQAVEWENLLYFPYPYFWGSENQGRDKLLFKHMDPEHERFLRAGYMRVVLTIRPGFEADFTRLVETGSLGSTTSFPMLTVAEEIAAFARTNYGGIPPANPEKHARPLLYPQQRKTWEVMEGVIALIEQYKTDNGDYPGALSDMPGAATTDAWGNPLAYTKPGSGNDYDLISYGADGAVGGDDLDADISSASGASLVATWFEYTPTSGIDIEVDTKPADIA